LLSNILIIFIAYKGNQPVQVTQAPKRMIYFEVLADCLDAAKNGKPSRCGWGMMVFLAALGPNYNVVNTAVTISSGSTLAKTTASDPDNPMKVAGRKWFEVSDIR
jgi:hypothetical protein